MKLAGLLVALLLTSVAHADPPQRKAGALKQLLLQHFDRNQDGRLQPRERKQAAKALRMLAQKLERRDMRHQRRHHFIERFDRDGDGNLGPGELPPGLADELRPLDRDGDGWLHGNEVP